MLIEKDDFLKYCKLELLEYKRVRSYVEDEDYLGFFENLMENVFECEDSDSLRSPSFYADYFIHNASISDFDEELQDGEDDDALIARIEGDALFVDREYRKICWSF